MNHTRTYLDIIDNQVGIENESELFLVCLFELLNPLRVITERDEQSGICPVESHVEHSIQPDLVFGEPLSLEFFADDLAETIELLGQGGDRLGIVDQ